ncbi:MAG: aspartyl protease family protein [Xanthobacteraceae bacterium]
MFAALLDTGASVTCVSTNVIQALNLHPSGKTTMSGSTGQTTVDQYTFAVAFLFDPQQTPTGQFSGQVQAHFVQGCEFTHHGFGFDILMAATSCAKDT